MKKFAVYKEGFVKENDDVIPNKRMTTGLSKDRAIAWLKSFEASRERNGGSREHFIQEVEIEFDEFVTVEDSNPIYLKDLHAK